MALNPQNLRIVSGPTRCKYLAPREIWEVVVRLPVYNDIRAAQAFEALPNTAEFDGHIYRKAGMRASDCTAWYRHEERI